MAIDLWLLRHGEAEPHGSCPDAKRRLTGNGKRQSRRAGQVLAGLEIEFDVVYTSPKVRARDTAILACEALGIDPVEYEPLAHGVSRKEARALVTGGDRVLLVGHDPYFSQLIHDVSGARSRLPKGGIAGLRLAAPGELAVLLRPRDIAVLAGDA